MTCLVFRVFNNEPIRFENLVLQNSEFYFHRACRVLLAASVMHSHRGDGKFEFGEIMSSEFAVE